jgi:UDP-N-acetylmuramyl pentapeptide phosphotransferase/UDP-N-acetylglucosamine-1-phosphate transferase
VGNRYGDDLLAVWGLILAAAAIGFLLWNLPRAHVFLGDVGSYGTGAIIGFMAWWVAIRYERPVTALAPLAIYLVDTAYTLFRRYRAGSSLLEAHREHVYQRLVAAGLSHVVGTGLVLAMTAAICAAVRWLPTVPAVFVAAAILAVYVATPAVATRLKGRLA